MAGCALLLHPEPFLALARAGPEVADKVRAYTRALAFALPPALLFAAFRGFNTAVLRPKAAMAIQLGGLALKLPLSALLVYGAALPGGWQVPSLGIAGCGIATAIVMWAQWLAAWTLLRRDPYYAPFGWRAGAPFAWPRPAALAGLLRLGVPMGLSILVEVTGFTFMAFFIARLGTTAAAGHQIAANLAGLLFMLPLALGNATGALVAQRVGAGDEADARRLGWHGLALGIGLAACAGAALVVLRRPLVGIYTRDAAVAAAALPLVAWVGVFHLVDAAQTVAAFVLRAWRIATAPMVVYALCVWLVGLGGGYLLAFAPAGERARGAARRARLLGRGHLRPAARRAGAGRAARAAHAGGGARRPGGRPGRPASRHARRRDGLSPRRGAGGGRRTAAPRRAAT